FRAAVGSTNMFGVPFTIEAFDSSGRTRTIPEERFQFVGHRWKPNGRLPAPVGKPEFQRKIPANCQPPKIPLTSLFASWNSAFPRPIGNPTNQFALMMWRTSKSESA